MDAEIYGLDKPQYRIIEKENKAGEKFYFLQRTIYGFNYYKRNWYSFWKTQLIKSELSWQYLYNDDKKGQFSNDYFDCLLTNDYHGTEIKVDLQLHLDKACKSVEEATELMHEHLSWIKHLQEQKKKRKEEEEGEKLNPEKEIIIPLYDTSGRITAV